jgi:hypothetical protein
MSSYFFSFLPIGRGDKLAVFHSLLFTKSEKYAMLVDITTAIKFYEMYGG